MERTENISKSTKNPLSALKIKDLQGLLKQTMENKMKNLHLTTEEKKCLESIVFAYGKKSIKILSEALNNTISYDSNSKDIPVILGLIGKLEKTI